MSEIAGIRPVERSTGAPAPVEAVTSTQDSRAGADATGRMRDPLEPAVTLDIGRGDASGSAERGVQSEYRGRYVRPPDSQEIVFQVIDPGTGTVMVQLPSPQAVEARTYAEAAAARAAKAAEAMSRAHPLDRTA